MLTSHLHEKGNGARASTKDVNSVAKLRDNPLQGYVSLILRCDTVENQGNCTRAFQRAEYMYSTVYANATYAAI